MPEQQFKRNTAYKLRIGDILIGKPVMNSVSGTERFSFLELGNKKIIRVNIIGNIVDKYESGGAREETSASGSENTPRKYVFFTLDDGSGQIRLKVFGDDYEKFKGFYQGQTVVVIGTLRNWNDETYISPEVIREMDTKYLLLRKLETEKEKALTFDASSVKKEQVMAIKDKILELIKSSESSGGIETEDIIQNFAEVSPTLIQQEIQKLLEEGIAFEPRPGKIRYLG
jgi:RPA family protein